MNRMTSAKVTKKQQAIALVRECQGNLLSRQEILSLLRTKLDMSPTGAKTYYHNVTSQFWT